MIARLQIVFLCCCLLLTSATTVTAQEASLLEKIQRDSCEYFKQFTNPKTGLTADASTPNSPSSIAATGFQLIALVIAAENGWLPKNAAIRQTEKVMKTLRDHAAHEHGFFYHFLSMNSGKRVWQSEASSIDTALVIAACLLSGAYFKGTRVELLANELYDRVDWHWMLNGTDLLCHGWKPESGFLPYYWDAYSEHVILQALAIGAEKNAISPECWSAWVRLEDSYQQIPVVFAHSGSLFTYQFSEIFINFESLYDGPLNYRENTANATRANKQFCQDHANEYPSYGNNFWGLSACLGPKGYKAYGAKPGRGFHDGTIAPYAVIGSLIVLPDESMTLIEKLYQDYRDKIYGPFGFKDGINLEKQWFSDTYIGIDQGASIAMIENYRSKLLWKLFMSLKPVTKWLTLTNMKNQAPAPLREMTITPASGEGQVSDAIASAPN